MMRLPALLCASGLAGLLIAPVAAQTSLPSRTPAPESAVVTPDAAPPVRRVVEERRSSGSDRGRPNRRALYRIGLGRSGLLREIVDKIDAGNVVVYLGLDPTMKKKGLAGRLIFTGDAGAYRYLRVMINPTCHPNRSLRRSHTNCITCWRSLPIRRCAASPTW